MFKTIAAFFAGFFKGRKSAKNEGGGTSVRTTDQSRQAN